MKYFKHIVIFLPLVLVILILIPNSPLNKPILHQLIKIAEENWKSQITYSEARLNLWKGELAFDELEIGTLEDMGTSWSLAVRNVMVEMDYPSWFMDTLKLNKLMIHDIFFSQRRYKISGDQVAKVLPSPIGNKNADEKTQQSEKKRKKRILVKHIIIQGRLEVETVYDSGKRDSVKIESININKKDIRFDGRPDAFVLSLINSN